MYRRWSPARGRNNSNRGNYRRSPFRNQWRGNNRGRPSPPRDRNNRGRVYRRNSRDRHSKDRERFSREKRNFSKERHESPNHARSVSRDRKLDNRDFRGNSKTRDQNRSGDRSASRDVRREKLRDNRRNSSEPARSVSEERKNGRDRMSPQANSNAVHEVRSDDNEKAPARFTNTFKSTNEASELTNTNNKLLSPISKSDRNDGRPHTNTVVQSVEKLSKTKDDDKKLQPIGRLYSSSLSRTPSPFLKHKSGTTEPKRVTKPANDSYSSGKKSQAAQRRSEESSSSESDSDNESKPRKRKDATSTDASSDDGRVQNDKVRKEKSSKNNKAQSALVTNKSKRPAPTVVIEDGVPGAKKSKRDSVDNDKQIEKSEKLDGSKSDNKVSKKKEVLSSDSDHEDSTILKKKLKSSKKVSDSSSDSEQSSKRKKHKKHKKHGKKHKKHKKHKKRSKKSESSDSEEEVSHVVVNDDLERQLRERALKSMKKHTSGSE